MLNGKDMIYNACYLQVLESSFPDENKRNLIEVLDKLNKTPTWNIIKLKKLMKGFETKFIEYGGDHKKLYDAIESVSIGIKTLIKSSMVKL